MQAEFHPPAFGAEKSDPVDPRALRYRLVNAAGRIMGDLGKRTKTCGRKIIGCEAVIAKGQHGAYIAGVETCGSVWVCAACAGKIAEGRRKDVSAILSAHDRLGGDVYMVAFTIPHRFEESCHALKKTVSDTWRKMLAGKAWKSAQRRFKITGYIRAMEITHGKNGWHPHLHVLLLTSGLTDSQRGLLKAFLSSRWISIASRLDSEISARDRANMIRRAVDFRKAEGVRTAGNYVCKWGVDSEITKANFKRGKVGGRSPWQILMDASDGDHFSRFLFREYGAAMKGTRHITWSVGLRDLYLSAPEMTDEEMAKLESAFNGDDIVGRIPKGLWVHVATRGLIPEVLNSAEGAGWSGVLRCLRNHRIGMPSQEIKEHERPKPQPTAQASWGGFQNTYA
jgi:hypothetical protein